MQKHDRRRFLTPQATSLLHGNLGLLILNSLVAGETRHLKGLGQTTFRVDTVLTEVLIRKQGQAFACFLPEQLK